MERIKKYFVLSGYSILGFFRARKPDKNKTDRILADEYRRRHAVRVISQR